MIPSPAIPIPALIHFVREHLEERESTQAACASHGLVVAARVANDVRMFSALLSVLERQHEQEEKDVLTRTGEPVADPPPQHAPTDREDQ